MLGAGRDPGAESACLRWAQILETQKCHVYSTATVLLTTPTSHNSYVASVTLNTFTYIASFNL